MRSIGVLLAVLVLTACGADSASTQTASSPKPIAGSPVAVSPVAVPALAGSLASSMTKDSGVYSIPLPSDATLKVGTGMYVSNLDTVVNFTGFYHDFMRKGWLYEPKYTSTDPAAGIGKSLGYTTSQIFCVVGSSPIRTVAIIVGSGNSQDQGKHVEISVQDDPGESSCP